MGKNYQKKSATGWWIAGAVLVVGLIALFARSSDKSSTSEYLTAATSLRDVHGLAVDVTDSSKVWIASHTGLHLNKIS